MVLWTVIFLATVTLFPVRVLAQLHHPNCESYEPVVIELRGTIIRKTFPGPPNYDNIRKGDAAETYWLLKLDSPVCVNADKVRPDQNPAQKDLRTVQLVLDGEVYKKYRGLVGKHVVAKGSLFGQITAHHHTPVLLRTKNIEPAQ